MFLSKKAPIVRRLPKGTSLQAAVIGCLRPGRPSPLFSVNTKARILLRSSDERKVGMEVRRATSPGPFSYKCTWTYVIYLILLSVLSADTDGRCGCNTHNVIGNGNYVLRVVYALFLVLFLPRPYSGDMLFSPHNSNVNII